MKEERPRICPECGKDTFQADDYSRVSDQLLQVREQLRRSFAQHAVQEANWMLKEIEWTQSRRTAQEKVIRQRRVINRLENKLLALKQQPYKE